MLLLYLIVCTLLAYGIGAIPIGAIVARVNRIDISRYGSGKTGMTNVLRTVGRRAAVVVLLGDFIKGSLAVFAARALARALVGNETTLTVAGFTISVITLASLLAAFAVVAGHVWSIYLRLTQGKWQGGRGVVPALGATLVVNPWIVAAAVVVGIPSVVISRYVSLGSILGAIAAGMMIIALVLLGELDMLSLLFVSLSVFIIIAHRDNIERLLNGTERKIGERVNI